MNLAVIHPSFSSVGGAEVVALNQALYLRDQGHDVRIVTTAVDPSRWEDKLKGFRVDVIGSGGLWDSLLSRSARWVRWARQMRASLVDVELAITHNFPMSHVVALADPKCKRIWYCHEPDRKLHLQAANPTIAARAAAAQVTHTDAEQFYLNRLRSRNSRLDSEARRDITEVSQFDCICVNSSFTQRLAELAFGSRNYAVLHPLMRLPESGPKRTGLRRQRLRILVHSRLEAPKNIDTVIRGFAAFSRRPSVDTRLHVVGEGGRKVTLQNLARQLGVEHLVQFHGYLPYAKLLEIYELCEVFALLPIDEPFGMVFPEAMSRGLIVIGPDHGGPFGILDEGRLGLTCEAFSPQSLALAMEQVRSLSDIEVDQLRQAAIASCRERFAWERIGSQMVTQYGLG